MSKHHVSKAIKRKLKKQIVTDNLLHYVHRKHTNIVFTVFIVTILLTDNIMKYSIYLINFKLQVMDAKETSAATLICFQHH